RSLARWEPRLPHRILVVRGGQETTKWGPIDIAAGAVKRLLKALIPWRGDDVGVGSPDFRERLLIGLRCMTVEHIAAEEREGIQSRELVPELFQPHGRQRLALT